MKHLILIVFVSLSMMINAQTKSKNLKLKYTPPAGWNAEEFGDKSPWETNGNPAFCNCAGVHFFKAHKEGKLHVVVYPSTQSGLDSLKRNMVGKLQFEDVQKIDRVRNKDISYERKKSNFVDTLTKAKSYDAYRYFAKMSDHFVIIYAWQDNMQPLTTNERELFQMVNAIEEN